MVDNESTGQSSAAHEEPPPRSARAEMWADVPDEDWGDWRWQLSHRLNTLAELQRVIPLTPEEEEGVRAHHRFRLDITPYFASLIDGSDPNCPIRRQVLPTGRELTAFESMMADSLSEEAHSPVPGLVHRYPDRVLMLVTTQCASYCRFCTRSRIVGDPKAQFSRASHAAQIDYIAETPAVRDVLISGGDPLTLPQHVLEDLLRRLRAIPHVEVLRIGTRVPVFLPQRINRNLVDMLRRYPPLWINIHFNHVREITPEVRRACGLLADAGLPLGSQSVLLAGINDCPDIIMRLVHELVKMRVRPYYLYQCDLVPGAGHFRTRVAVGLEIIEALRGHTSGFAVPTFVIDAPGGGGKVPIMPQYVISQSCQRVVLRNFEGFITTYAEPESYEPHARSVCPVCQSRRDEGGQEGVAGLLEGDRLAIVPEGFERVHHRLTRVRWSAIGLEPSGQGEEQ
ncbi:MAG: lysine 2,3-aminomutase [Anaerolineales bacterium]|nr:MAG: lysine 2,3-aminomutase [Anaerolineales bacterium]